MKTGIKVADAMTNKPVLADSHLTITECAKLMRKHDVGSVLVKEGKEIVGILTETDFVINQLSVGKDLVGAAPHRQ